MCFSAGLQPLSHSVSRGSQCSHRHCALGVSADVPPLLKAAPRPLPPACWLLRFPEVLPVPGDGYQDAGCIQVLPWLRRDSLPHPHPILPPLRACG